MKVGDYVRTRKGYIAKYKGIEKCNNIDGESEDWFIFDGTIIDDYGDRAPVEINKSYFIKSSPNIIDLIEKDDLLKIEYYSLRYEQRVERLFEVAFKEDNYIVLENTHCDFRIIDGEWLENDKELQPIIKSILTKDQFLQMEYRMGG